MRRRIFIIQVNSIRHQVTHSANAGCARSIVQNKTFFAPLHRLRLGSAIGDSIKLARPNLLPLYLFVSAN